jgi:hypothetical protein
LPLLENLGERPRSLYAPCPADGMLGPVERRMTFPSLPLRLFLLGVPYKPDR